MVNPVNSTHHTHPSIAPRHTPAPRRPEAKPSTKDVQDKVTLKRAGDLDHDGDSK